MIKLTSRIYSEPTLSLIMASGVAKNGNAFTRAYIFLRLLILSSEDYSFVDSNQFSSVTNMPPKQCELVWGVCMTRNVLRPAYDGFSARQWLIENGFMDTHVETGQICLRSDSNSCVSKTLNDTQKSSGVQNGQTETQFRPDRVFVRHNVTLSTSDISALKSKYSDAQLEQMYDKLSAYKEQTGRRYPSDYQAIERWVNKAVIKPEPEGTIDEDFLQIIGSKP